MPSDTRQVRVVACNRKSGIFRDAVMSKMHKRVPAIAEDARGRVRVRIGKWEIWLDANEFVG